MVELTDEEKELVIKDAMVKKHAKLEEDRKRRLAEERRNDVKRPWTPNELYAFARLRATNMIRYETGNQVIEFEPAEFQKPVITALSLYFTEAEEFEQLNPNEYNSTRLPLSLQKGIWLFGAPGVGKTLLMQMFNRNKRLCYQVVQCPKIVNGFMKEGDSYFTRYQDIMKSETCDAGNYYQKEMGVCFNDLGVENPKASHFGNTMNVMEAIFLEAYERRVPFFHRHVTTNLTLDQVRDVYGARFLDRIRQCFNILEVRGSSLRK